MKKKKEVSAEIRKRWIKKKKIGIVRLLVLALKLHWCNCVSRSRRLGLEVVSRRTISRRTNVSFRSPLKRSSAHRGWRFWLQRVRCTSCAVLATVAVCRWLNDAMTTATAMTAATNSTAVRLLCHNELISSLLTALFVQLSPA